MIRNISNSQLGSVIVVINVSGKSSSHEFITSFVILRNLQQFYCLYCIVSLLYHQFQWFVARHGSINVKIIRQRIFCGIKIVFLRPNISVILRAKKL